MNCINRIAANAEKSIAPKTVKRRNGIRIGSVRP